MDFAAAVYLSWAQNPKPPPTHCIRVYSMYTYLHREGVRGGELNQRQG
jgi:hypothetical protein